MSHFKSFFYKIKYLLVTEHFIPVWLYNSFFFLTSVLCRYGIRPWKCDYIWPKYRDSTICGSCCLGMRVLLLFFILLWPQECELLFLIPRRPTVLMHSQSKYYSSSLIQRNVRRNSFFHHSRCSWYSSLSLEVLLRFYIYYRNCEIINLWRGWWQDTSQQAEMFAQ